MSSIKVSSLYGKNWTTKWCIYSFLTIMDKRLHSVTCVNASFEYLLTAKSVCNYMFMNSSPSCHCTIYMYIYIYIYVYIYIHKMEVCVNWIMYISDNFNSALEQQFRETGQW